MLTDFTPSIVLQEGRCFRQRGGEKLCMEEKNAKSFPSHKAHRGGGADLHFLSAQPDTSLHCWTTSASRSVLLMPQLLLVLTAPTREGMARLSWPAWLVTCQRSPIQVLNGPGA